jgi:hypothetical protein
LLNAVFSAVAGFLANAGFSAVAGFLANADFSVVAGPCLMLVFLPLLVLA